MLKSFWAPKISIISHILSWVFQSESLFGWFLRGPAFPLYLAGSTSFFYVPSLSNGSVSTSFFYLHTIFITWKRGPPENYLRINHFLVLLLNIFHFETTLHLCRPINATCIRFRLSSSLPGLSMVFEYLINTTDLIGVTINVLYLQDCLSYPWSPIAPRTRSTFL